MGVYKHTYDVKNEINDFGKFSAPSIFINPFLPAT